MITILKSATFCKVNGTLSREVFLALREALSYLPEDFQFRPAFKTYAKDGRVHMYKYGQFPTGLLKYAQEVFKQYNVSYTIAISDVDHVDNQVMFNTPNFNINEKYILRDYQEESIVAALSEKRGLIQAPTGAGKSLMAARFIERANVFPALVCLRSKDLLNQTIELYEDYLGIPIGKISEGRYDIKAVTVAMDQTLYSGMRKNDPDALRYLKSIKTLVMDECHHQAAKTVQRLAYTCKSAEFRIGYSGTPVRDLNDDMEIEAALGTIIYKIGISDLIDKGYLVPPRIYMLHMPKMQASSKPYPTYQDIVADYIENNPVRDKLIAQVAKALLDENKLVLILCNRIEHGKSLAEIIPDSIFVHGSTELCMRNLHLQEFKEGKRKVMIASSIIDEGWDCPPLDALILAHPYKSLVKCYQRLGRSLRTNEGKDNAIVVDFFDHVKFLDKHAKRRMELYKREPRFEITESRL